MSLALSRDVSLSLAPVKGITCLSPSLCTEPSDVTLVYMLPLLSVLRIEMFSIFAPATELDSSVFPAVFDSCSPHRGLSQHICSIFFTTGLYTEVSSISVLYYSCSLHRGLRRMYTVRFSSRWYLCARKSL